jgi:DNA repair photolyase
VRALARLAAAGIPVTVNVMPVLPGITDEPRQLETLVCTVAASGAVGVAACALRLQSAARQRYLPFIEQEFPELAARYHATYAHAADVGERYRVGLRAFFRGMCARYGVRFGYYDAPDDDAPALPSEQLEIEGLGPRA